MARGNSCQVSSTRRLCINRCLCNDSRRRGTIRRQADRRQHLFISDGMLEFGRRQQSPHCQAVRLGKPAIHSQTYRCLTDQTRSHLTTYRRASCPSRSHYRGAKSRQAEYPLETIGTGRRRMHRQQKGKSAINRSFETLSQIASAVEESTTENSAGVGER